MCLDPLSLPHFPPCLLLLVHSPRGMEVISDATSTQIKNNYPKYQALSVNASLEILPAALAQSEDATELPDPFGNSDGPYDVRYFNGVR